MNKNRALSVIAALAACAAIQASVATGQETAPAPGCQGTQLVDKKGDSSQPSTDILAIFYTTAGGKTFANLQLADIKPQLPDGSTQWFWYVEYEVGESLFRLQAFLKPDGSSGFKARKLNRFPDNPASRGVFTDVGTLPGKIFLGKNGVVQWELSDAVGVVANAKLFGHFAAADEVVAGEPFHGTGYLRVVASIDNTTDVKSKEYTVRECAASETPPASTDPPPSAPSQPPSSAPPTPGSGNEPRPATGQPGQPASASTSVLDITVAKKVPRVKRIRKTLVLTASSKRGVSNLEAILLSPGKNGKVVARGKLASLKRKGKLKLKVSKKIKKGTYTLQVAGRNADGTGGTRSFKLKFK